MAEEIIYEQVEGGGDPDPLGLRKKAAAHQAKPDPLKLREKAAQAPQPSAFNVNMSSPTFGAQTAPVTSAEGTVISGSGIKGPKEFTFDKPYDPMAVQKLQGKAREAQKKLHSELQGNDKQYEKNLREIRRDSYTIENLREDYKSQGLILAPQDEQKILLKEKQKRYDAPVTADDIADIKTGTILDQNEARKFIKNINKPEIQENAYLIDKYNELASDPDGNHRVEKIKSVAKQIAKGDIIYDPEKKIAIKPLGLLGSAIEGVKNKFKMEEEHDFFKEASDATIINQLEADRNKPDTDEPLKVPKGKAQEIMMTLGEMPVTPMIAGVAGTVGGTLIGNPELGVVAASALGAYENAKINFTTTFRQVYNELRDQGIGEQEAVRQARKQADNAQEIGALVGAAQGVAGAGVSSVSMKFSPAYKQSIGKLLSKNGIELGKLVLEGSAQGAIGAAGEGVKNKLAQSIGIKREITAGMADQFWDNMFMAVGIGAAIKAGRGMAKTDYKTVLHGLSKVPDEAINSAIQEKVIAGDITQEAANQTLERINEYKQKDSQIPANVTEEARFKIQDNIDKLNELEAEKEATHKSLQEPIKERIQKLEEANLALLKETEKSEVPESGLSKAQEKEAIETAEEFLAEGILPDVYESMIKQDPIGFWKMIAQQAQNMDENWKPLSRQIDEQAVRDQFGDTVVDYAKELFPAPEPVITTDASPIVAPEDAMPADDIAKPYDIANVSEEAGVSQGEGDGAPVPSVRDVSDGGAPVVEAEASNGGAAAEPEMIGITHAQMDAVARDLGIDTYQKDSPESLALWDTQARERLAKDPDAINKVVNKMRNGDQPDKVETRMLIMNLADKKAKYNNNPTPEGLNEIKRLRDLYNISGREEARAFFARRGSVPVEETLADFHMRDTEYNRAPLTEEQTAKSTQEYENIRKTTEQYDQKIAQLEAENIRLKAEKKIKEAAKSNKKAKADYRDERRQIITDIREKLRKARGETSVVAVPYAKELIAIAPDVMKLVRSYVDQGISELPELVKNVRGVLADYLPEITEKDVHNIIAGTYSKRSTKSQLAQQVSELRKEAKLINDLEALQRGEIPVNEKKRVDRNRRIEALKSQIKELRDEMGLNERTDEDKLSALKSRYKKQIAEIEKKIADGDFGPDEKPEPIKLDAEAIELKDKMIKAKAEREARLAQMEYEQRTKGEKALDLASQSLDTVRTLQTNPDMSFFGRQGIKFLVTHPVKGAKLFWESAKQATSQKRYDRWLYDIHNSPAWQLIEDSGLAVLDPHTLNSAKREEAWRSQLIHKIPVAGQVAKASERAFTSAANMARVEWFMEGVGVLRKQDKTWESAPEEYKGWASAVNNMTGRGGLGGLEPVVGQLAIPFWSPRLIAANVNLFLNPMYYVNMPAVARRMLIASMAQYVVTGIGMLYGASKLGAEVEADPRSSDFGKIKVGNTRYDVWGGGSQYIRAMAQFFKGQRKSGGEISELNTRARAMTLFNLTRTKLSPIIGFGLDATLGENVIGEKVEWTDAYRLMIPMLYNDIKEAAKDEKGGPGTAAISGLLSFLGIGAQTYGGKASSASNSGKPGKAGKPKKQTKQTKK